MKALVHLVNVMSRERSTNTNTDVNITPSGKKRLREVITTALTCVEWSERERVNEKSRTFPRQRFELVLKKRFVVQ